MKLEFTSTRLAPKEIYSRAALAKFFGISAGGSLSTGVFRPDKTRYKSVWLFVTEEKSAEMTQYVDRLDGNILHWQGQEQQYTDQLVITHEQQGLELLVFLRKHKRQYPHGAFVYEGAFEYVTHDKASKPTNFTLRRRNNVNASEPLPKGPLDSRILNELGSPANTGCRLLMRSLVKLLTKLDGVELHFTPLSLLAADTFSSAMIQSTHSGQDSKRDELLSWHLATLSRAKEILDEDELFDYCEKWSRLNENKAIISICNATLAFFMPNAAKSGTSQEFSRACSNLFNSGVLPFLVTSSHEFVQVHPTWITFLRSHSQQLLQALAADDENLTDSSDDDFEDSGTDGLVAYSQCPESNEQNLKIETTVQQQLSLPGLETRKPHQLSLQGLDRDVNTASSGVAEPVQNEAAFLQPTLNVDLKHKHEALWPASTHDSETAIVNNVNLSSSSQISYTHASTVLQQERQNTANLPKVAEFLNKIRRAEPEAVEAIRRFMPLLEEGAVLHLILIISTIEAIRRQQKDDPLIPLSVIGQFFFSRLWFITMRGVDLKRPDLCQNLHIFFTKPAARDTLFKESMVTALRQAISRRIQNHNIDQLRKLADETARLSGLLESNNSFIRFELQVFDELKRHGETISKYCAAVVALKLCEQDEIPEDFLTELYGEDQWLCDETTALFRSCAEIRAFSGQDTNKQIEAIVPNKISDDSRTICDQLLDETEGLLNWNDGIGQLESLFEQTSASYKFLLFGALLELIRKSRKHEFTFDQLAVEMMVITGKIVTLNGTLSFGGQDFAITELTDLGISSKKYAASWTGHKEQMLRNQAETKADYLSKRLMRYVPYLLIRPFFDKQLAKSLSQEELRVHIASLSRKQFTEVRPLYCINPNNNSIVLHSVWREFISRHFESIEEWWQSKFQSFLRSRNPMHDGEFSFKNDDSEKTLSELTSPLPKHETDEAQAQPLSSSNSISDNHNGSEFTALQLAKANEQTRNIETYSPTSSHNTSEEEDSESTNSNRLTSVTRVQHAGVFAGIDSVGGVQTVYDAFNQIYLRLNELPTPRSLCELDLSDDDYEFLKSWAKALDVETARQLMIRYPDSRIPLDPITRNKTAIGCLLALLCSEVNRREGQEGAIWPLFLQLFDSSLDEVITSQRFDGHVSYHAKVAMKAAFENLGLRNVLEYDDHAYVLVSIFLQFGFTRYGLRNLPVWLAKQNLTQSVQNLCADHSINYSASFAQLWEKMHQFFHKRITKQELKSTLERSSWVLGDWHDDIIRVLENPDSRFALPVPGQGRIAAVDSAPITAKLRWSPPREPHFQVEIDFNSLRLDPAQIYTATIGEMNYAIFCDSDEWRTSAPVTLFSFQRELAFEITDQDKSSVYTSSLKLWEESDVQVFDMTSGRRVTIDGALRHLRPYAIIASDDLEASPAPDYKLPLPSLGASLYFLSPNWPSDFSLLLDGELLWSAIDEHSSVTIPREIHTVQAFVERKILAAAEPVTIAVKGETEETRVTALRVGGIHQQIHWNGSRTETAEPVDLGSLANSGKISVTLKVRHHDKQYVIRRKLNLSVRGSAIWNGIKWDSVAEDAVLDATDCKNKSLQCSYDLMSQNASDFGLFESNLFVCRASKAKMQNFAKGFGGELTIRRCFNPDRNHSPQTIAASIVNRGLVHATYDVSASEIRLETTVPLSMSDNHTIIIWPSDSEPILLSAKDVMQKSERSWDFVPFSASTDVAIAVCYDGVWLGADWPDDLGRFLSSVETCMNPLEIAALLQWIRWPLLERHNLEAIRSFVYRYPEHSISAWVLGKGLRAKLVHEPLTPLSDWYHVAQELLAKWSPSKRNVLSVTEALYGDQLDAMGTIPITRAAEQLWGVSPILLLKYLKGSFDFCQINGIKLDKRMIIARLETAILGGLQHGSAQLVLAECARQFSIDSRFADQVVTDSIEQLIDTATVDYENLNNLYMLLSKFEGRRFISLKIIEYFKRICS